MAKWRKTAVILTIVLTIVAVAQIILCIVFYNCAEDDLLANIGWLVLALSGVFGWLPIYTLRQRGGVPKGRGYMHTTALVDTGVYGIVRHPQYLAGVLMSVALTLIAPHWAVAATGVVAVVIYYLDTFEEERRNVEKFGDAYDRYRERVPRLNFVVGIVRRIQRRASG